MGDEASYFRTDINRFYARKKLISVGRQDRKVKARSLLCFWASRELGLPHTILATRLEMSAANVGFSVERGETVAKEGNYSLEK